MKNKIILILYLFIISCSSGYKSDTVHTDKKNRFINTDIIELSSNEGVVDFQFLVKIPTNKLIFNKNSNGFSSIISIDAIFTTDNKIKLNESWTYEVFVDYFEDTKLKKEIVIDKVLSLPLGIYEADIIINDYQNHISWHKEINIELDENFNMSDILLYKKNNNRLSIISDDELEDVDTLWVQYQFNNLTDFKSYMDIQYDFFYISNINNKESIELDNVYLDEDVIFKNSSRISVDKNGINYYPIEIIDDLFNGLVIKIIYNDNYRYKTILLDRYKEIDYNLENIIGPMEYILENSNFKNYREYTQLTIEDKINYIRNYWNLENINDENSNKLFEEFYKRVEYVNRNFKYLSTNGWSTDRGKVYIIYGEPLQVKEEFTTEGEYKIWIYKNNKQFIFYNRYGPYILIDTN